MSQEIYTRCSGDNCPKRETCRRFIPFLNKLKVFHFATVPYDHARGKCNFYDYDEDNDELPNQLNIVSGN
jgi:hypothetical protein